ncbi:hypothetical protein IL306_009608 [Fusarium sp. DS 682]|nr:hypothetical protein IL306_009608 [Fusarium sp. DS 682]
MSKCFSLMNLISPIAGLHLGIATLSRFATDENLAGDVFRAPLPFSKLDSRQLLSFIPARYGTECLVTHAVDCLISRIEQIMLHNVLTARQEMVMLRHYTSALRATQEAIDHEAQRMAPETLCATQFLGIFEVRPCSPRFMSQRPLGCRATSKQKVDEPWQQVMRTAIHSDSSIPKDQRALVFELWSDIVHGPNTFVQVAELALSPTPPSKDAIESAVQALQKDEDNLRKWLGMARDLDLVGSAAERHGVFFTPSLWSGSSCNKPPERILCPVLQGTFLMCYIIKARLLSSISPCRFHYAELECQALAHEILSLEADPTIYKDGGIFAGLFLSQTVWVAKSIHDTKDLWATSLAQHTAKISVKVEMIEKPHRLDWKHYGQCGQNSHRERQCPLLPADDQPPQAQNPAGFGVGSGALEWNRVQRSLDEIPNFEPNATIQTYYNIMAWTPFSNLSLLPDTPALLVTPEDDRISPAEKQKELIYDRLSLDAPSA